MSESIVDDSAHDARPAKWTVRGTTLSLASPVIVGILNVTPDSFSDGGEHLTVERARDRVRAMCDEGMDILDVGGESTRPGSVAVGADEELRRIVPVIRAARCDHPSLLISVDTTKASVARAALDEGVAIVNDVSAMRFDRDMASVVAEARAGVILMHSRGGRGELAAYDLANYHGDVASAVEGELRARVAHATSAGILREAIVLDPGIGFAKRAADSVDILRALPRLARSGFPLLVGASRKRLIASLTRAARDHEAGVSRRVHGTVGVHLAALALGARLFRVHDVRAHRDALDAAWAILGPERHVSRA